MATRLEFDFEWRITLFTLALLPLLISLGFWQLHRAEEKAALAMAFEQQQARPPAPLAEVWQADSVALAYLPVALSGRFRESEYFLLDNRMSQRRYGNEVLTVFELDGGGLALVNRGWVQADPSRQVAPSVPLVPGTVRITGHVYVTPGQPYLLADENLPVQWPKQIQAVEMDKIRSAVETDDERLFPYPVRIDANQPGALAVDWQIINASPEKHHGYAVQWFAMAFALAVIYILRSSNLWQLIRGKGSRQE
ncbi:SURF1 family protein [Pseudohalioglobus lutimaris]|uniref:SURF1-like protein n=1 Tax=Pseudohalioglobus lutimaris TaxID=1737061 RepID=A0A2N5X8N7_9GAMM|nr:SURF1 family protein [Pseudohalioglobus lutimaris]PLW70857.1 SURF1 family protein [Pseudohalioglobus lutimaris]